MNNKSIHIRPTIPEKDFAALAPLLTQLGSEPVTEETLYEWEQNMPPGRIRRRTVAVTDSDQIAGYGITNHNAWQEDGRFFIWTAVPYEHRNQGLGGRLYEDALQFALDNEATVLDSEVRDNELESLRFAEKRGYTIDRHVYESVIALKEFDERPFAGLIESVEAGGIRFFSLAEAGNTEEAMRKLHAVNARVVKDDPASSGRFPDFAHFRDRMATSSWFLPEGQFMAADGDDVIGLAAVGKEPDNTMVNLITGVDRAYRGRKIAQALKLLTIRFARTYGAAAIRTDNDSTNHPMLAINRKLGYQPQPGWYRLLKQLDS
jgi:GNAT superfamily N-acetyltransferase